MSQLQPDTLKTIHALKNTESVAEKVMNNLKVDKQNTALPAIEQLYEELFRAFGGIKGFAEKTFQCFNEAKEGSQVQARILESIMEGFKILADRGKLDTGQDDAAAMTDDDLQNFVKRAVVGVVEKTNG